MNQSDVEKKIHKYRNSWKEYKSIQIVIKRKWRQRNKYITCDHIEREMLTILKKC